MTEIVLVGTIAIVAMLVLMALSVPVAVAMALPALVGVIYVLDPNVLAASIDSIFVNHAASYPLVTIPLFVLMGEILYESGLTAKLYDAVRVWFGRVRGGLAFSSIGASAMFAASSGSSVATTSTMGVVASKEMLNAKYDQRLISGAIVAGGGLGILIPPSTIMIVYGTIAEESIGKLLIAGLVPGILLALLLMVTVAVIVAIRPSFGPGGDPATYAEKFRSITPIFAIGILFVLVVGAMYSGFASPTESAAVGVAGAIIIAAVRRSLSLANLLSAVARAVRTTGFIFAIILGSFMLNYLLAITRIANNLASFISGIAAPTAVIFAAIVVLYLILGAFMDAFAMVVITVPIMLPIVDALNLDPIWFGVIVVLMVEMALITPPVGMNNFILHGVAPQLKLGNIMKGAVVFCIPILATVVLLYIFPEIALFLPSRM
ncbi:TRAP transporter large permease [Brevibacterium yomogidense]